MRRGISRLLCHAGLVAVGLGGAALLVPATAGAVLPNPPCGSTVYSNVKLHSNMNCSTSPTDGLVVGKSGITINLNGFEIIGPGPGAGGGTDAIDNSAGFNHVTVKNGSVAHYYEGVVFYGSKGALIKNVTAEDNDYGVDVEDSTDGLVTDSTLNDNVADGAFLYSDIVTVSDSDASYNSFDGIEDYGDSLDTINADTMNDNGTAVVWPRATNNRGARLKSGTPSNDIAGRGLYVNQPLTVHSPSGKLYYTIEHSTADDNYDTGFYIDDNSPTTLFQADVFSNTAEFNGQSGNGFGFWAYQQVKGFNNGARGNASGNCHHVKCHSIP